MASYIPPKPHYGGQLGLLGLLAMLGLTGCMALSEAMPAGATWMPSWAQQTSADTPAVLPAQAVSEAEMKAVYIVRFEADPGLTPVGRQFRKDATAARAAFADWAADKPELEGLDLIRASYSGELILGLPKDTDRTPDGVLEALNTMENLIYAERDVMAGVGQRGDVE